MARAVKRQPYESDLVEDILIIGMILPEDQPDEFDFDIVDICFFEFPCLIVGVFVRIEGNSAKFFPVIGLVEPYLELNFGGNFALM